MLVGWEEALLAVADRSECEEDEHATGGGHEDHHHMSGGPRLAVVLEFGQLNGLVHRLLDRVDVGGVRLATSRFCDRLIGWRGTRNRHGAIRSLPSFHAVARVQIRTDLGRRRMLINHFDRFASCFHYVHIFFLKIKNMIADFFNTLQIYNQASSGE